MLDVLGEASTRNDAGGRDDEHATLVMNLSNEADANGGNRLVVSVTNLGPDPAYKVLVQLKSGLPAIHGVQLRFGRINRNETKKLTKEFSNAGEADELNPIVVATAISSNATPLTVGSKLRLVAAKHPQVVPLQLSCMVLDKEPASGQRLRIQCEASNSGDAPVHGLSFQVVVGKAAAMPATGPVELAAYGHVKFELAPTLSAGTRTGASVPIIITMNAPDIAPIQQQMVIRIFETATTCKQAKLTRDAYRIKHKRAQAAAIAKSLTQTEADGYDFEWVSCLEILP